MFNHSLGEPNAFAFQSKHKSQAFFCDRNMSVNWVNLRFNIFSPMERNMQSRYNSYANRKGNRSLVSRSAFSSWLNWLTGGCNNWSNTPNFYQAFNSTATSQTGT